MPYKHLFRRPYIYFTWFAVCALVCAAVLRYEETVVRPPGSGGWSQLSIMLFDSCGLAMQVFSIIYWAEFYKYSRKGHTSYDMLNFISIMLTLAGFAAFLVICFFYLIFKDGFSLPL